MRCTSVALSHVAAAAAACWPDSPDDAIQPLSALATNEDSLEPFGDRKAPGVLCRLDSPYRRAYRNSSSLFGVRQPTSLPVPTTGRRPADVNPFFGAKVQLIGGPPCGTALPASSRWHSLWACSFRCVRIRANVGGVYIPRSDAHARLRHYALRRDRRHPGNRGCVSGLLLSETELIQIDYPGSAVNDGRDVAFVIRR